MTTTKHDELGTLSTTPDGEPELRFERRLRHPIERAWAALTDPRELAAWFPAAIATEWRPGAPIRFTFPEGEGEGVGEEALRGTVVAVEPPRLLEFRWDRDRLRFELSPDGDGCRLIFVNTLHDETYGPHQVGAGWHVCFEWLEALLVGRAPKREAAARVAELEGRYRSAFGT
ncbi:MAG TPA: SRPBCC family protein [Candidatus Limnocylindrales bacterium]|nr:SRPBCC family protein [Candidatus Limnocylindrales bacterium]